MQWGVYALIIITSLVVVLVSFGIITQILTLPTRWDIPFAVCDAGLDDPTNEVYTYNLLNGTTGHLTTTATPILADKEVLVCEKH